MRVGDPDGYSIYGQVEEFDGRLVCHECGRMFVQLATHLYGAHGITAAAYREAHGLGPGLSPRPVGSTCGRHSTGTGLSI